MEKGRMSCPCCGYHGMLFAAHNGMEHNVCERCGTVIECDTFTVDVYEQGSQDVPFVRDAKPSSFKAEFRLNTKLKTYQHSKGMMTTLMDRLNLPVAVREMALNFLIFTKSFEKLSSIGACVYLAMKQHDIPITIRYISNYLQVSHFSIGKTMKKLEKRIGVVIPTSAFGVERLTQLIFNQAKFGGDDGGKKRFDLMLKKTEKLIQLLQECQATTGYCPHLMILASGYVVWRNLKSHGWYESNGSVGSSQEESSFQRPSIKFFMCEMGIQLSSLPVLYNKVNLIINLLKKFAKQIPWVSVKNLSRKVIFFHLDDFLEFKSQIIELTAQDLSKQKTHPPNETDVEIKEELGEEDESNCENGASGSSHLEGTVCVGDKKSHIVLENITDNVSHVPAEENAADQILNITFDTNFNNSVFSEKVEADKGSKKNGPTFRKIKYTKMTNFHKNLIQSKRSLLARHANISYNNTSDDEGGHNGFSQLLEITHPGAQPSQGQSDTSLLQVLSFP